MPSSVMMISISVQISKSLPCKLLTLNFSGEHEKKANDDSVAQHVPAGASSQDLAILQQTCCHSGQRGFRPNGPWQFMLFFGGQDSWNKPLMFVTADTSQVEICPASASSCSRPSGDSHCKTAARSSDLCEKALVFVESSTRTLLYNCFSELQAPCRRLAGDLLCPSEEPKLDRVLMGSWLGS